MIDIVLSQQGKINPKLINEIVDIHMKTFKNFFLTFLGKGFLRQLYKGFYEHKFSGIILASENDKIVGFLAYSENMSDLYKYLIKHKLFPLMWYSFIAFLKNPRIAFRLFRAFLKPSESIREENYLELSSVGVTPEKKELGIGTLLVDALKKQFLHTKSSYIKLETDADNNESVNNFYIKNGFEFLREYVTPENRRMNEYIWRRT